MTSASKIGRTLAPVTLAGVIFALAGCSGEPEQLAVEGSAKAAKLEQCVKPTEIMRRNHMELIKHQRVATVRNGIRATDNSLAGCIDCHVQYDTSDNAVPVNAEGQFCSGCHEYISVSLDCFQCHSPVPDGNGNKDLASRGEASLEHVLAMTGYKHEGIPEKGDWR